MAILDGGGVRGYWTLLLLKALVDKIAFIERGLIEDVGLDGKAEHSFYPQRYPRNVSQNLTTDERRSFKNAQHDQDLSALGSDQCYLICHYFDYICGTSTGS